MAYRFSIVNLGDPRSKRVQKNTSGCWGKREGQLLCSISGDDVHVKLRLMHISIKTYLSNWNYGFDRDTTCLVSCYDMIFDSLS